MLIEKEDAIKAVCEACYMFKYIGEHYKGCKYYPCDDVEALETVPEAARPSGDLISRAEAIEAVRELCDSPAQFYKQYNNGVLDSVKALSALPSAEAEPKVIRSRTLLPTKDFKEFAKRIREENSNVIVIPCDAEVVSAEATCSTCADRAVCIMSAPDGQWKACKNYRAEAAQGAGRYENAMQKLREMPKCLNGVKAKQIKKIPSEAVQGEWKPFDLTWGRNVYFCTACKESTEVPTVNGQPSYNFCPNCGARMCKGGDTEWQDGK